ncbi:MAG: SDR family NAD(P)-dependent oxidoreductase, partial [Thermomicrobium sp.]
MTRDPLWPVDLTGRVACITGGSGGLGLPIAMALAQAGAHVAILGRDQERLARAVAELRTVQPAALALPADVTDPSSLAVAHA